MEGVEGRRVVRPVAARILSYRDVSTTLSLYTLYAIEFRYPNASKEIVEKRFTHFSALWDRVRGLDGFESFTFPGRSDPTLKQTKVKRRDKFDELIKLVLALAPEQLNKWISSVDAEEDTGEMSPSIETPTSSSGVPDGAVPAEGAERPPSTGSFREQVDPSSRVGALRHPQTLRTDHKDQLDMAYAEIRNLRFQSEMAKRSLRRFEIAQALQVTIDDFGMDEGHVEFVVNVTSTVDGTFQRTVRRRYSEFVQLHANLYSTLSLPSKSFLWKAQEFFLRQRAAGLEHFLQRAVRLYNVCAVPELAEFLEVQDDLSVSEQSSPGVYGAHQGPRQSTPNAYSAPMYSSGRRTRQGNRSTDSLPVLSR
uniref:PX domain-containing protein n=1 Tax=Rhizochromulina marina TaxID=1034831 RepID=A0A7S2WG49_9STRA|mmetsp:Transcript_23089/g.67244  ORF Transcript_23089/g.67244 Transcript_23089/m.67244 type:complete len:365 (+) Transcript_23089:21-1115(+)